MKAILAGVVKETGEISSFRLGPEKRVSYTAGQWVDVRLTDSLKHHFTLSSSPTEPFLQFTTKFRTESEYKRVLWSKRVGDTFEIRGPFGEFVLDTGDLGPRIFIAGGIGITPFRSMLRFAVDKKLDVPATLLYSVKNRGEGAFIEELERIQETLRLRSGQTRYRIQIIETEREGRLNAQKIKKYCPNLKKSTVWLCGPPVMVESLMEVVTKMGFAAEAIHSEEFTGY